MEGSEAGPRTCTGLWKVVEVKHEGLVGVIETEGRVVRSMTVCTTSLLSFRIRRVRPGRMERRSRVRRTLNGRSVNVHVPG